jgi:hypothetical protein
MNIAAMRFSTAFSFFFVCWRFCHVLVKLQCSNNCASFLEVLTLDWDCWNCHLLMCSLACCLSMKLVCTVVRKYTPEFVSFVLQCKCAWKVQDDFFRSRCFENCVDVFVICVLVFTVFLFLFRLCVFILICY